MVKMVLPYSSELPMVNDMVVKYITRGNRNWIYPLRRQISDTPTNLTISRPTRCITQREVHLSDRPAPGTHICGTHRVVYEWISNNPRGGYRRIRRGRVYNTEISDVATKPSQGNPGIHGSKHWEPTGGRILTSSTDTHNTAPTSPTPIHRAIVDDARVPCPIGGHGGLYECSDIRRM